MCGMECMEYLNACGGYNGGSHGLPAWKTMCFLGVILNATLLPQRHTCDALFSLDLCAKRHAAKSIRSRASPHILTRRRPTVFVVPPSHSCGASYICVVIPSRHTLRPPVSTSRRDKRMPLGHEGDC